jgi:peptidoglycan/xylan/chitin deacetylase (PgdA/CDA1 family)
MQTESALILTAAALAVGAIGLYGTFVPTSSLWGKVIWRAAGCTKPQVSLTFDDGPTEGFTDRILDRLGELDVKATFFVIGRNVARCPDLLRRMDAEGHLIANHTYDHGHFDLFRGWGYWNDQLRRTDGLIAGIIGKKPALFRPAMGITTLPIHHAAHNAGLTVVAWSRRARDGVRVDPLNIERRIMRHTGPGDILMLHDGIDPNQRQAIHCDRGGTVAAIPSLIAALRRRGLNPVRLDQLLGVAGYAGASQTIARRPR